jgi:hypothetical protein
MRLNPKAFDAWLGGNIGQSFLWRKAYRCPCVNLNSGAATPGCPQCGGKSWLWTATATPGSAGMSGQQIQMRWAQMGLWEDGDAVVTIHESSPLYEMGQFDRVTMLNSTDYFSLPLVHGGSEEKLFEPIEKITRVFWLDVNKNIVEGGIPMVNSDGTLTWSSGAPPSGTTYSITGTRYSQYFCWGRYPSDRNEHFGARLPKRVVLRRFDLFGRDAPN